MNDYDAIQETIFHYFEGYKAKNRERLEKAIAVEIGNISGYCKNAEGKLELFSLPFKGVIDEWVSPDHQTYQFSEGKILSVNIFADVAATVVFDCGGMFLDTHQLVKMDGSWRIVNKFFVEQ